MFLIPIQSDDKINELLEKDDVKLEEILEQDSLSCSIRNSSNQKLFSYLKKPDVIEELVKWALTEDYRDHPKYLKLANSAVTVFTNSKLFQQIALENETFLNMIQNFINTTPQSSRVCGHFNRIINSIILGTKGDFIEKLNNLQSFLINNITDMALKDLFVFLSTEFSESFSFNTELLIHLVKSINYDNCLFVVSTIREIIYIDTTLKKFFDSEELIDHLFKIAIETSKSRPLLATELFRLLKNFKELSYYIHVLKKYVDTYEYQDNFSLPYAISIFNKLTPEMFDLFFDPKSCTMLTEAIYESFTNKTIDEQLELTKSAHLFDRIISNFPKSKTKARFSDLAILLANNFKEIPDIDQGFIQFVENDVKEHLKIRQSEYGGKIMHSYYDDIIDIKFSSSESSSSSSDSDEDEDEEVILELDNDNENQDTKNNNNIEMDNNSTNSIEGNSDNHNQGENNF